MQQGDVPGNGSDELLRDNKIQAELPDWKFRLICC